MVSVQNNDRRPHSIAYIGAPVGLLTLTPGINLNIPPEEWAAAERHPIVKAMLEEGTLEVLGRSPLVTSDLAGFDVVDNKATSEPMPVLNATVGDVKPAKRKGKTQVDPDTPTVSQGLSNASIDPAS